MGTHGTLIDSVAEPLEGVRYVAQGHVVGDLWRYGHHDGFGRSGWPEVVFPQLDIQVTVGSTLSDEVHLQGAHGGPPAVEDSQGVRDCGSL